LLEEKDIEVSPDPEMLEAVVQHDDLSPEFANRHLAPLDPIRGHENGNPRKFPRQEHRLISDLRITQSNRIPP
jgi:hypothetical protein